MSQKNNHNVVKSPFCERFVTRAIEVINLGLLPTTDELIVKKYIKLWLEIYDGIKAISEGDLAECRRIIDMGFPKTDPYKGVPPPKGSAEYIKYQLGQAMVVCDSGLTWSLDGYMTEGVECLSSAYYYFSTSQSTYYEIQQLAMLEKFKRGPKSKSLASEEKWSLARQYFLEEIPKHKTLKKARKAAAERAGIYVEERQLALKLPNPNPNPNPNPKKKVS